MFTLRAKDFNAEGVGYINVPHSGVLNFHYLCFYNKFSRKLMNFYFISYHLGKLGLKSIFLEVSLMITLTF